MKCSKKLEKSKNFKSSEPANKITKKSDVNPLLIAYTYFLNNNFTKFISIGFDSTSLTPLINLEKIGKSTILWDILDWTHFTINVCTINNFLNNTNTQLDISFTNFHMYSHNGKILIKNQKSNEVIDFTADEISNIIKLMEFLNSILYHYKSYTVYVQEYYK